MLNEPVETTISKTAVPTIIAFLINSIYSLADTYLVSLLGTNANAAVGVNASLDQLIMMCGSMLAVGANRYIARLLGSGEDKKPARCCWLRPLWHRRSNPINRQSHQVDETAVFSIYFTP